MKTITKKVSPASRARQIDDRAQELFPELFGSSFVETPSGIAVPSTGKVYGDDFDIIALMNEAKDPDTGLMRDLKIDDGDLHHASSYYDFVFNVLKGDAHPPWMMQMWIGVMLFAEFCPICSNKKWLSLDYMINNVDKRAPSEGIIENIKMLKHGVCPKCKRHKYDLIKNHGLRNYVELVNILGQRSGKSASAAGYSAYVTHRYLKFPKLATLTKAMQKSTELTATFVSLTFSKAFSLLWTPYINIVNESKWFCLASGSSISLADGTTKPIEDMVVGDEVRTIEGHQPVTNVFDNGYQECFEIEVEDGRTIQATADHKFNVLRNGTTQWVKVSDLLATDEIVTA